LFRNAALTEIRNLEDKGSWEVVKRSEASGKNVLPSTWALKKKRYPDDRFRRYETRFCVKGDQQRFGLDYELPKEFSLEDGEKSEYIKMKKSSVQSQNGSKPTKSGKDTKRNAVSLGQRGLINGNIKATGMENANNIETPAMTVDVGGREQMNADAVKRIVRMNDDAVKRIVRYIETKDKGLYFGSNTDIQLAAYADADFAGLWGIEEPQDPTSVKSRSGYLIRLGGCPIIWRSKLQTLIAVSTMEAEYISLSMCMRELIPLRRIFIDLSKCFEVDVKVATAKCPVFEDNSSAATLANVPKMTPRSKHIALHYHFFREHVRDGSVGVQHVSTDLQIADMLTKGLSEIKFERLRKLLMNW